MMYGCMTSLQLVAISISFPGQKVWPKYFLLPSINTACFMSVSHAQEAEG